MTEHVKALWRGERSLAVTFWLYGLGAVMALNLLVNLYEREAAPSPLAPALLGLIALNGLYRLLMTVAVWRSARRFSGDIRLRTAARLVWLLVLTEWGLRFYDRLAG